MASVTQPSLLPNPPFLRTFLTFKQHLVRHSASRRVVHFDWLLLVTWCDFTNQSSPRRRPVELYWIHMVAAVVALSKVLLDVESERLYFSSYGVLSISLCGFSLLCFSRRPKNLLRWEIRRWVGLKSCKWDKNLARRLVCLMRLLFFFRWELHRQMGWIHLQRQWRWEIQVVGWKILQRCRSRQRCIVLIDVLL